MSKYTTVFVAGKNRDYVSKVEGDEYLVTSQLADVAHVSMAKRIAQLEAVLMTESEKSDLLSKEHYRNRIAQLEADNERLVRIAQTDRVAILTEALRKAIDCIRWNCPNVAVREELEKVLGG